jgi:hypothetical protein
LLLSFHYKERIQVHITLPHLSLLKSGKVLVAPTSHRHFASLPCYHVLRGSLTHAPLWKSKPISACNPITSRPRPGSPRAALGIPLVPSVFVAAAAAGVRGGWPTLTFCSAACAKWKFSIQLQAGRAPNEIRTLAPQFFFLRGCSGLAANILWPNVS